MRHIGKNPDRDFCAGYPRSQTKRSDLELQRLADPESWGKPLHYGDLLTNPNVQSRIARIIVHSASLLPRYSRW